MSNTIEYLVRVRDEVSAKVASMGSAFSRLGDVAATGLVIAAQNMDRLVGIASNGLGVMRGDFSKLGDLIGMIPGPIGVVGSVVGNVMGEIINKTVEAADSYRKLSEATGASVEFLSRFTEAADDVFVSSESVSAGLTIFAKKLGGIEDAMDGSGASAGKFAKRLAELGITTDNAEDALMQVADVFAGMPNGVDKAALATELFGKRGAELIPILNQGSAGIKAMGDEAEKLGLVLTDADASAVRRLKASQDQLNDSFEALARRVGVSVIPRIAEATEAFNNFDKRTRVMYQYIDARNVEGGTLAEKLFGRVATWQMYTEVAGQFVETLSVSSQALNEFGEWSLGAGDALAYTTDKAYTADRAYQQMYGNLNHVGDATLAVKDYTNYLAEAEARVAEEARKVADAAEAVNSVFARTPELMDKAEKAETLLLLASGNLTIAELGKRQAIEAVRDALDKGIITYEDAAKAMIGLRDGTISTDEAFERAKSSGSKYKQELDEIKRSADKIQPREVNLTVTGRFNGWDELSSRYDHFQNRTVTVTVEGAVNVAGSSSATAAASEAAGAASQDGLPGGYTSGGGGGATTTTTGGGNNRWDDTQGSARFNVNSPVTVINTADGAQTAQKIAREQANVARRAKTRAALMG